jgi:DNA replication protein DnaC
MRLPKRYWNVDYKETQSPRDVLKNYLLQIEDMKQEGLGLLLWGPNGTGKTSMAAIIAKEFRRRFSTVLFIEAASLKTIVTSRDSFDEESTYWQRAKEVDVLVLDDLGKGVQDGKGFGEQVIDELIRTRNANQLVTIITSNISPKGKKEALSEFLKPSTMASLKEHVKPIYVRGVDQREIVKNRTIQQVKL